MNVQIKKYACGNNGGRLDEMTHQIDKSFDGDTNTERSIFTDKLCDKLD